MSYSSEGLDFHCVKGPIIKMEGHRVLGASFQIKEQREEGGDEGHGKGRCEQE